MKNTMDIGVNVILFACIASCFQGTDSDVTVSPLVITVLEGNNATVRCIYNGENSMQGVSFSLNQSDIAIIFLPNCTFNALGFVNYITACEGNKTLVVTLVNVSRHDHGKTLTCTAYLHNAPPIQSSSATLLNVNVPIKNIAITSNNAVDGVVSVCEKQSLIFHCKTSAARPAPDIKWVYGNKFSAEEEISSVSSIIFEKDGHDFSIASSTINVTANRSFNSWNIFCIASNIPNHKIISSSLSFNILYPPVQPPSILNLNMTRGETFNVIEGRHEVVTCVVPGSNPVANLSWKGLDNRQAVENSIVTNTLEWVASRQDANILTCIAKHLCNDYEMSIYIMIKVLYPPTIQNMVDISIIEGSMLNITCNVTLGLPEMAAFKWTRHKDSFVMNSQSLIITNVSRDSSSTYTCAVANVMKPTIGPEERGESSGSLEIEVLYPPTINSIDNFTILEGSYFSLACPVHPGNPNDTEIIWSAGGKIIHSVTKILSISNTSREHDMIYTCTVSNIMKPTNKNRVKGTNSESFHLIVEYHANVEEFYITGHYHNSIVTINEHENVTFLCHVSSNPISVTGIKLQSGQVLVSAISNDVSFDLGPAKCLDAGMYECSGKNRHNIIHATRRHIGLLVKCSPRANPLVPFNTNITTRLNAPSVTTFTALSYPLPYMVLWQKFKGYIWTNITPSKDVSILQVGLNFSLTIYNVVEEDLGQYRLVIANDIGQFEQQFAILAIVEHHQDKEGSGNESLIGGVIGSIIAIAVTSAICISIYILRRRVIRKRKMEDNAIYQNDIDADPRSSNNITEYEEISTHQYTIRKPFGERISDTDSTSNAEKQYEILDQNKKERNDYSQLSRVCVELGESNSPCSLPRELKSDEDVPVYTNMKI